MSPKKCCNQCNSSLCSTNPQGQPLYKKFKILFVIFSKLFRISKRIIYIACKSLFAKFVFTSKSLMPIKKAKLYYFFTLAVRTLFSFFNFIFFNILIIFLVILILFLLHLYLFLHLLLSFLLFLIYLQLIYLVYIHSYLSY